MTREGEVAGVVDKYVLKLYVTGRTPRAERAIANLRRICDDVLEGRCDLMIVDVLDRPELAEEDRILATPTLICQFPPPNRRIVGDLSDANQVVLALSLPSKPKGTAQNEERGETA